MGILLGNKIFYFSAFEINGRDNEKLVSFMITITIITMIKLVVQSNTLKIIAFWH